MIDSDGQVVRALRVKMEKTEKMIDRSLREDAREAVRDYLASRNDFYPWLFISQSRRTKFLVPGPLTRSAVHQIVKKVFGADLSRQPNPGNRDSCSTSVHCQAD
jgi:hypothetical protein